MSDIINFVQGDKVFDMFSVQDMRDFMLDFIATNYGYTYNPVRHKDIDEMKYMYTSGKDGYLAIAYTADAKIVGTLAGRPYPQALEKYPDIFTQTKPFSVWRTYVHANYTRRKIGSLLYAGVEAFAQRQGYTSMYLHAQQDSTGALPYWEKQGFSIIPTPLDERKTIHFFKMI